MVDVFISYSRTNQEAVRRLAEAVKREGYSVWWDDELPPHLSYSDVITDKIGTARAAIVVWSADASASEWVRAEADVARNQKKLIQTSIDDRMPPMPFNQIQFASIGDWQGEADHPGWLKVKASLAALCGPAEPTAATAYPLPSTPPPRAPTAPPAAAPVAKGRSKLLPAIFGVLIIAVLAAFYLLFARGGPPPAGNQAAPVAAANQAAPAPAPATQNASAEEIAAAPITDAQFNQAATVDAPTGSAEVRSGPASDAFVINHVQRGAVVTTYQQTGDWWQVRTANGAVGYLPHRELHILSAVAAAPAAPQPAHPAAAPRPVPHPVAPPPPIVTPPRQPIQTVQPRFPGFPPGVRNPDRYCKGPGRGTPPCRGMRGGY